MKQTKRLVITPTKEQIRQNLAKYEQELLEMQKAVDDKIKQIEELKMVLEVL